MTKIPTVEERVEDILSMIPKMKITVEVGDGENDTVDLEEVLPYELTRILTADRTALLTELKDSGLLEEYTEKSHGGLPITYEERGHNTLARAIKAHLDELINSTSV